MHRAQSSEHRVKKRQKTEVKIRRPHALPFEALAKDGRIPQIY